MCPPQIRGYGKRQALCTVNAPANVLKKKKEFKQNQKKKIEAEKYGEVPKEKKNKEEETYSELLFDFQMAKFRVTSHSYEHIPQLTGFLAMSIA